MNRHPPADGPVGFPCGPELGHALQLLGRLAGGGGERSILSPRGWAAMDAVISMGSEEAQRLASQGAPPPLEEFVEAPQEQRVLEQRSWEANVLGDEQGLMVLSGLWRMDVLEAPSSPLAQMLHAVAFSLFEDAEPHLDALLGMRPKSFDPPRAHALWPEDLRRRPPGWNWSWPSGWTPDHELGRRVQSLLLWEQLAPLHQGLSWPGGPTTSELFEEVNSSGVLPAVSSGPDPLGGLHWQQLAEALRASLEPRAPVELEGELHARLTLGRSPALQGGILPDADGWTELRQGRSTSLAQALTKAAWAADRAHRGQDWIVEWRITPSGACREQSWEMRGCTCENPVPGEPASLMLMRLKEGGANAYSWSLEGPEEGH